MSKKKKEKKAETTIENFYDLKVDEVDELVSILKGEGGSPDKEIITDIQQITGEEVKGTSRKAKNFDPYKRDKLAMLPTWLKAVFIKWWFAGAVCYFIVWGLSVYIQNDENLMLLTGVVLGIVVDIFVNPAFRYLESDRREYDPYIMFPFPFKQFWTFFTNIIYYVFIMFLVARLYGVLQKLTGFIDGSLAVEPLLFATFCLIIDMAFIGIKDAIVYLVKKNSKKRSEEVSTDV